MNEQNNLIDPDKDCYEERLQYECEQAFLRTRFAEPSGGEEWKKFQCRLRKEKLRNVSPGKRDVHARRFRMWVGISLSMAGLALVVVFILFLNVDSLKPAGQLAVIVESVPVEQVVIEEPRAVSAPAAKMLIPQKQEAQVEKKGIVFSSTEADYTRAHVKEIRRNIVSIPRGQVYKLKLSDGTEVWMNADSRLSFPTRFSGSQRMVNLEGEAYFKVARNVDVPFVIVTDKVTVRVLGTEFNIKSYRDSETHVTLFHGSVQVSIPKIDKEVVLEPGEDIAYSDNTFRLQKIDIDSYTQWKDGYFYFDNVSLPDILKDLGHWYNVTVEMEPDSFLLNLRLHFIADRNNGIESVIENLNSYGYLYVTKKGDVITVRRKNRDSSGLK